MANERDDFEIDFKGGSVGFKGDKIGGHHQPPVDINYDRPESHFTHSPRLKWEGVEGLPKVTVMRRDDLRNENIFALKIVDPLQDVNMLLPAGSIVSRIIHPEKKQEMIWYKDRGKLEYVIVGNQSILEKYERRV